MTVDTITPQQLSEAVRGDLEAFSSLLEQPHSALQEARAALPDLVLTPASLRKVLLALQEDQVSPDLVQKWASFVRWGLVANSQGPIRPIEIDYEPLLEDLIAEVIARLDEIGDLIDGEVPEDDEITIMLDSLAGKRSPA